MRPTCPPRNWHSECRYLRTGTLATLAQYFNWRHRHHAQWREWARGTSQECLLGPSIAVGRIASFWSAGSDAVGGDEELREAAGTIRRLESCRGGPPTSLLARLEAERQRALRVAEPMPKRPLAGELARRGLGRGLSKLLGSDPDVRLGHDREAVHQGRVATRRLRANLRTFAPVLGDEPAKALRSELGWLGERLGAVRDIDVLVELLAEAAAGLGEERAALAILFAELSEARRSSFSELIEALCSQRYLDLVGSVVELADSVPATDMARERGEDVAGLLVAPSWRRLRERVDQLGERPSDRALHKVRIRAKELRYACEAVEPVAPPEAGELARAAKALQSVLGEHQDYVVLLSYLRGEAGRSPAHGYAAGLCLPAGLEGLAAQSWRNALQALSTKRLRRWFS